MRKILLIFCFVFSVCSFFFSKAQNYNMQGFELILKPLMEEMLSAESDNERFAANEKFMENLEDALNWEKSFSYPFPLLKDISILTSPDKQFRILTWAIVSESGDFENFGFVQAKNSLKNEYEVYRLFDRSDNCIQPELEKLNDSSWYGAVYYDLITTKNNGNTYYLLLGWDGNNIYSRRKIIEPISFARNSARPIFGQTVFYKEKDRKRYIFEYSTETTFNLKYETQYYNITSNKKAKSTLLHKAKPFEVEEPETDKKQMIFFDVLEPMAYGMEGFTQGYVPSGEVTGLYFEDGKWKKLKHNVLPRNKKDKKDTFVPNTTKRNSIFPN